MANMGTVEFTAKLDTNRLLDVVRTLDMMKRLLDGYGHAWTPDEQTELDKTNDAFKPENLAIVPGAPTNPFGPDPTACPEHGAQRDVVLVAPRDVVRCVTCRAPLERGS